MGEQGVILLVEDDKSIAEAYARFLRSSYLVRVAHTGADAIESLDEDVDIALLDRNLPDTTGAELLERVQTEIACPVVMVTGIQPDFDVLEMGFDDYLVKPVSEESLLGTVDGVLRRAKYDSEIQEFFSLASKRAVLQQEKKAAELEESDQFSRLEQRMASLKQRLDRTLSELKRDEAFELVSRRGTD